MLMLIVMLMLTVDDGDEDKEWAAPAVDASDKQSTVTKTTITDSLATTDNGEPDEYVPPEDSEPEEALPPPEVPLYLAMRDARVIEMFAVHERRWRDAPVCWHARDVHGFSTLAWAAHNGNREVLLPVLQVLRPLPSPDTIIELPNPALAAAAATTGVPGGEPVRAPSVDKPITAPAPAAGGPPSDPALEALMGILMPPTPEKPISPIALFGPLGGLNSHWLYSRALMSYRTHEGDAPLMWAVKEDHLHIVKALLGMPWVNPHVEDALGYSALLVAVRQRQLRHVRALLRCPHLYTDRPGPDGITALIYCVHRRYRDMIDELLSVTRCNPNQKDTEGWTPLTIAVRDNDMVLFHTFFDCMRTDPNVGNATGVTTLALAAYMGNTEVVRLLLAAPQRCNLNAADVLGESALMCAVRAGHVDIVKAFLELPELNWVHKDAEGLDVVARAQRSPNFVVRRIIRGRHRLLLYVSNCDWYLRALTSVKALAGVGGGACRATLLELCCLQTKSATPQADAFELAALLQSIMCYPTSVLLHACLNTQKICDKCLAVSAGLLWIGCGASRKHGMTKPQSLMLITLIFSANVCCHDVGLRDNTIADVSMLALAAKVAVFKFSDLAAPDSGNNSLLLDSLSRFVMFAAAGPFAEG